MIKNITNNPMLLSKIVQESVESELNIFWSLIADNLPKSIERSALGDEKIYQAFKPSYLKFRNVMLVKFLEAELERKKGMFKESPKGNDIPFDWGIESQEDEYKRKGRNLAIQEDIVYLEKQIEEIKKLI